MEKKINKEELLKRLLIIAKDPFTTCEQKFDIRKIFEKSTNFAGRNHLFLVQCYFAEENPIFIVSKEEAILQAKLAVKEGCIYGCYYLFLLLKETRPVDARNCLRIAADEGIAQACLEMAKCQHYGIVFEKNRQKAYENYAKAAGCGMMEGYYGMLLMASEDRDIQRQKNIYEKAKENGIELPGITL